MQQWEYMTLRFPVGSGSRSADVDLQEIADHLNARGLDGWELVSTESLTGIQGQTMYLLALLKRPKV